MTSAPFVFTYPGQGSQVLGMGKALADASVTARAVFQEVDDALGQHLSKLMWEGPEADLTLTQNAQPALMAVGVAATRFLLIDHGIELAKVARFTAGHSLGEYTALAASGALALTDTARLLRHRGQAMQRAVPVGVGAMAALLGVDMDFVRQVLADAAQGEIVDAANDNAPGQVVISGTAAAVERAVALAKAQGKKAMMLSVSAPFHCALMQPAADEMADALADATIKAPLVPLYANVTAAPVTDPAEIRKLLVAQVTGLVRWRESIEAMAATGVTGFVELGAGKVLSGMAKRIVKDANCINLATPDDVEAFAKSL
jgi:[acyl-carrier-protein] S-malonyltransferase